MKQRNQWIMALLSEPVLSAQVVVDVDPKGRALVYKITNPNGKTYIGVSNDLIYRLKQHLAADTYVSRSLKKYGLVNHTVEVLAVLPTEPAFELERKAVVAFDALEPTGLNLSTGGMGGRTLTDAGKQNLSNALKGKKKHAGFGDLLRKANLGVKRSSEARENMRRAQLGKKQSPETIEKRAAALRGKPKPPGFGDHLRARKGQKKTPAQIEASRKGLLANWSSFTSEERKQRTAPLHTASSRLKIAESRKGVRSSDLAKGHMSISAKRYWANLTPEARAARIDNGLGAARRSRAVARQGCVN